MSKKPLLFVDHVLKEIDYLQQVAMSNDFEQFRKDPSLPRAASYSLKNISEAVRNIPAEWLDGFPGIEWAKIRGFGNIARHEYFRVDLAIVWHTIAEDLSGLRLAMETLQSQHKKT